jgi:hypothetical protein
MADMQKGMRGLGKMGNEFEGKPDPAKKMGGEMHGEGGSVHSVHDHGDGSFHTEHPDGSKEDHADHKSALASVGHKITGGDKHHIVHHDGMSASSHSIHEDGQHEDHGEHNTAEEAKGALDKFMGEEAQEPMHQHDEMGEQEHEPAYGAM